MTHSFTLLRGPSEPDTDGVPLGAQNLPHTLKRYPLDQELEDQHHVLLRRLGIVEDAPGPIPEHHPASPAVQAARRATLGLVDPIGHQVRSGRLAILNAPLVWTCHVAEVDRRLPSPLYHSGFLLAEAGDPALEDHYRAVRVRRLLQELERQYPPFNRAPLRLEDLEMIADHEGIRLFREPIPCLSCLCYYQGRLFILLKRGSRFFLRPSSSATS